MNNKMFMTHLNHQNDETHVTKSLNIVFSLIMREFHESTDDKTELSLVQLKYKYKVRPIIYP